MKLKELKQAVLNHKGVFHCVPRDNTEGTSLVNFHHHQEAREPVPDIPNIGKLREYYSIFGDLWLYHHEESGDAAFFIATPKHWQELRKDFWGWIEMVDDEERKEIVPNWVEDSFTIGEIPSTGNYLLVPMNGAKAGYVFEFIELGSNLLDFIEKALSPNSNTLRAMASHMTFFEENSDIQWWIEEMRDNNGNVIRTNV